MGSAGRPEESSGVYGEPQIENQFGRGGELGGGSHTQGLRDRRLHREHRGPGNDEARKGGNEQLFVVPGHLNSPKSSKSMVRFYASRLELRVRRPFRMRSWDGHGGAILGRGGRKNEKPGRSRAFREDVGGWALDALAVGVEKQCGFGIDAKFHVRVGGHGRVPPLLHGELRPAVG